VALLLVGEHRIRRRQLLEPILRRFVVGVAVRVPLEREPSVRCLDLGGRRPAADLEGLV